MNKLRHKYAIKFDDGVSNLGVNDSGDFSKLGDGVFDSIPDLMCNFTELYDRQLTSHFPHLCFIFYIFYHF